MAEITTKERIFELQNARHYYVWADSVKTILETKALTGFVVENDPFWATENPPIEPISGDKEAMEAYRESMTVWIQKDAIARDIIQSSVSLKHRIVPSSDAPMTARDIWKHYESTMRKVNASSYLAAYVKLSSLTLESCGGSHEKYCCQFNKALVNHKLAASSLLAESNSYIERNNPPGVKQKKIEDFAISECIAVVMFVNGTNSYEYLRPFRNEVTNLGVICPLETMMRKLRHEQAPTTGVVAKTARQTKMNQSRDSSKPRKQCTHCKFVGHSDAECWHLHPELRRDGKPKAKAASKSTKTALAISEEEGSPPSYDAKFTTIKFSTQAYRDAWIAASGAGDHFCNCRASFKNLRKVAPIHLEQALGSIQIDTIGEISILLASGHRLDLRDVIYAPQASCNILSLGRLQAESGVYLHSEKHQLMDEKGRPIGNLLRRNGVYFLDTNGLKDAYPALTAAPTVPIGLQGGTND